MRPTRRSLVLGLACLTAALSVGAPPLAACDPMWLSVARPDGISVFVAIALAQTVIDTVATGLATRAHPAFGRRLDPSGRRTAGGQRARLVRWTGDGSGQWREAVLVPWAYREDCSPVAWTDRLDWIPAGTRGAVTGWLRPRDGWLDGLPTFDVEMAWREPMWAENDPRWFAVADGPRRMTPEEFVELHAALPTFERFERSPGEVSTELRRWEQAHPALAALAPATTMLAGIHRAAEERSRHSLAGRWTAELALLDSRELPLAVTARAILGEIRLDRIASDTGETYVGHSTIDFSPLGFRLGSTEVLAIVESGAVRLILDPTVDHGHVVGTLTGGREGLAGTWYLNSRPARASGALRLERVPVK
jgi:hypothetical protein